MLCMLVGAALLQSTCVQLPGHCGFRKPLALDLSGCGATMEDPEVQSIISSILAVRTQLKTSVDQLGSSSNESASSLNRQIQSEMSRYRALLRDFELFVEEEDRCVHAAVFSLPKRTEVA